MFDISWGEFIIVGVVALIVIGPKELPGVIRAVGRSMAKLRAMAGDFRSQFDDALREAELHDVKKEFDEFKNQATGLSTSTFDPIRKELQSVAESAKATASGETGVNTVNETVQSISAEAQAMETEIRAGASDATTPPTPTAEPTKSGNAA
ncbi:MAG: Sec-independent protein translocase protein TatB [Beijerinckiaceae bacterium]|jgi:sec-independent protein translocase protein TatB|nr:Sec-independent protein translocase protein TatB [Beijerinckiaceae bacterium]